LKPKGALIALFFTHSRPDGPLCGTNLEELELLFDPYFDVHFLEKPNNSMAGCENDELLTHSVHFYFTFDQRNGLYGLLFGKLSGWNWSVR
jgi:hypothetical protein